MDIISYLFIGLIFLIQIIGRCLSNFIFDIILALGIIWLIFAIIYSRKLKKLNDLDKIKNFKLARLIIRIIFWVTIITFGIIINVIAGPIHFM